MGANIQLCSRSLVVQGGNKDVAQRVSWLVAGDSQIGTMYKSASVIHLLMKSNC
jgi:hypothetical protein